MIKKWLDNDPKVTTICVLLSVLALIFSAGGWLKPVLPFDAAWLAILLCGVPIVRNALRALIFDHDIKADLLVSIALVASLCISDFFEAGEVGVIMQIGSLLEDFAISRASGDNSGKPINTDRAPIVRQADRWASWMVGISLVCALLTGLISGQFTRAITVLVVFCPCAFILATPTAIAAVIGNLYRYGVLIQSEDAVERLAKVTDVVFDKKNLLNDESFQVTDDQIDHSFQDLKQQGLRPLLLSDENQGSGDQAAFVESNTASPSSAFKSYADIVVGTNADAANKEGADVVLVREGLKYLPYLFRMAKKAMRKITQNMVLSLAINLTAVVLSILGVLNPVTGALVHNCGSLIVVINATLLLTQKDLS